MKFLRGLLLVGSLLLASSVMGATKPKAPEVNLKDATVAVYHGKQVCAYEKVDDLFGPMVEWGCKFKSEFTCSGTVVAHDMGGYIGLTAGHCFDWEKEDEYYISTKEQSVPVLKKIKLIKFENDDRYDFAVFVFESNMDIPTVPVSSDEDSIIVGGTVSNVNYSFGLVKQFTEGKIISGIITDPAIKDLNDTKGRFLVNIGIGPGASGSAVVANGKIIGLVEGIFPTTQMPTIVIPTGHTLENFMEDDSAGLKPKPEPKKPEFKSPSVENKVAALVDIAIGWVRKYLLF